ncbi:acyl-CoA dehydrogenase family protein [Shimia sagamensis]|uniref:Acyl-CoA dehydrogenase n=1 Tax=Shimia sagamensis TaxID=1566352 RepID=A0ABY1NFK7_9RHOB|nr:acyl-CoA dehydrogenase family protein [Shimia sagamensis]SMP08346.1 acyl-CoA dehydrogenase [Shimia sagamensis]
MELLNEDQQLIADSATGFLRASHSITAFRALREAGDTANMAIRSELGEMGWMGIVVPEELGGLGLGYRAAGLIAEELGRNLTVSPFLSSAILAGTALASTGGAVAQNWAAKLAVGEAVLALAVDETAKHRPKRIATSVTGGADDLRLNGRKTYVVDGGFADRLIVTAKQGNDLCLLLIDPQAAGVTLMSQVMLDSRNAATVVFEDVAVREADVLAQGQAADTALSKTLAAGRAVVAAEQLGVAKAAADQTYDYLRTRKQFGVHIGQFQALQHRAADLYCALAQVSSLIATALNALDDDSADMETLTRAAKAKMARVGRQATEEGVQMHGGIGMTDEMDLGLFMKRDRALTEFLGDAGHHTEWILRQRGI